MPDHPHHPDRTSPAEPVPLDRRTGPYGEVVLRRRGEHHEIIANGVLPDGHLRRPLRAAARSAPRWPSCRVSGPREPGGGRPHVLIGGLGVGFSLAEAAAEPRWGRITVVEREQAILDWHRAGPLAAVSRDALADPRTELLTGPTWSPICGTLPARSAITTRCAWTSTTARTGRSPTTTPVSTPPTGLAACLRALTPGGVLAVWSAQPSSDIRGFPAECGVLPCSDRSDPRRPRRPRRGPSRWTTGVA